MERTFVLIHSPLVGPRTWTAVAAELRQRGVEVAVPSLDDGEGGDLPFWRRHAAAVARSVGALPEDRRLVLAGHSGAGPLLPAIRKALGRPVAAYLFVDAGIPVDGKSRLDLMAGEDPTFAEGLRAHLAAGGRFPAWTDQDLRETIPDARLRHALLTELRPRPLAFFEEPLPVFTGWPDAPCGYLRFSPAYAVPADRACRLGWVSREMDAGHFHMLVDPTAVADTLIEMVERMEGA